MKRRSTRLNSRHIHQARPRLCVFRSSNHIYAQVIDDKQSCTLASASSCEPGLKTEGKKKTESAALVGALVGKRAVEKGVTQVVFDRCGYKYHGRVKALAEAARSSGLKF